MTVSTSDQVYNYNLLITCTRVCYFTSDIAWISQLTAINITSWILKTIHYSKTAQSRKTVCRMLNLMKTRTYIKR